MTVSDLLWIVQALIAAFGIVLWSNFKDVKRTSEQARKEMSEYKVHVAEKYVTSTSLEKALETVIDSIKALFVKLDKIDDKLDLKADKK